jgi:molecular chaperone DnaJ
MFPESEGLGDIVNSPENTISEADRARFTSPDPYIVLGVARDCDEAMLKNAWRSLSKQYHPDKNDESLRWIFENIHAAYQKITGEAEERAARQRKEKAVENFMRGDRGGTLTEETLGKFMRGDKRG